MLVETGTGGVAAPLLSGAGVESAESDGAQCVPPVDSAAPVIAR